MIDTMRRRAWPAMRTSLAVLGVGFLALLAYILVVHLTGNVHTVEPGQVYRAGQPSAALLSRLHRTEGIRSVLNLRGPNSGTPWYDDEVRMSRELGVEHIDFRMSAKQELTTEEVERLLEIMRRAPKPMLIHCSGGSDRTGLASAFYVAAISKRGEMAAEDQLSLRFGHIALPNLDAFAMNRTFERMEPALGFPDS